MNEAHWHLVVNHLPIIFPLVGVIVIITGLVIKSEAVKRTSFLLFIIGALTTIAAMNTGEGAEDVVEKVNALSESYIEKHEESAETFALLSYILGGLSIFGWWASLRKKAFSNMMNFVILAFAIVVVYFGIGTGTTGGEISHPEIRIGQNAPTDENLNMNKEHED